MNVPGTAAVHAVISDACREGRGDAGAIDEAVERIRRGYLQVAEGWPVGAGAKIHVVLLVERPKP